MVRDVDDGRCRESKRAAMSRQPSSWTTHWSVKAYGQARVAPRVSGVEADGRLESTEEHLVDVAAPVGGQDHEAAERS